MFKGVSGWLKEQFAFIFVDSSEVQKPTQTLQTPLNTREQKAFSATNSSNDSRSTSKVPQSEENKSDQQIYLELLKAHLMKIHVRDSAFLIEPDLSPALPYANEYPLSNLLLTSSEGKVSEATKKEAQADIWSRLALHHAYVLLGAPGSGKTTLLLHLMETLTEKASNHIPNKLPILLFLRDHSETIYQKPHYSLPQAIEASLKANPINPSLPSSWFEERLIEGECLVMLDGLNEIPPEKRDFVLRWIERQLEIYEQNLFLVTSRPVGYEHLLKRCIVLKLEPFTAEQVAAFVKACYLLNQAEQEYISLPPDKQSSLQQEAEELCTLMIEPQFSHLIDNPLRVMIMTSVYQHRGTLPHRQVDLYAEYIDLLLQNRALEHEFNLSPAQKRRVLQVLAYQMMEQNLVEIAKEEAARIIYVPLDMVSRNPKGVPFLEMIAKESSLLQQSYGRYRFKSLFWQEYLAALHLTERRDLSEMTKHLQSSWWHETIRFCAMSMGSMASTEIVGASLATIMNPPKNEGPYLPALQLAISCVQEMSTEIKAEVLHHLERILELQIDSTDPVERRLVAETLLDWRLKRMMRVNQDLYVADALITNAEYRLFIEEQRLSHPELKQSQPFLADSGQKAVTGLQAADAVAFCEWLTKRNRLGFDYRLPYSGEFSPLVSKIGYWTQKERQQGYELEEQARHELSLRALESRLRSLIVRDIAHHPDTALSRLAKFDEALERAFDRKAHRLFALGLARDLVHDRAHERVDDDNPATMHSENSHWYAHFVAWLVTHKWLTLLREEPKPRSWLEQFDRHRIVIPPFEQKVLAEEYFELYNELATLEEASLGQLVTNRGIRIVGERRLSANPIQAPGPLIKAPSNKRKVLQKKICLLGDEGVGKTSLVRRFVEGRFDEKYLSTMGVSISRQTVEQPSYTMNMVIWDMEGAPGFEKMQLNYLRGAAGALIVCDLTHRKTFAALERYAYQLQKINPSIPMVFIGNKIDLPLRQITIQDLEQISTTLGKPYLLTSAKTGTQVEQTFCLLADLIEQQSES